MRFLASTLLIVCLVGMNALYGQKPYYSDYTFSEKDTLRGMLRPERTAYDVHYYQLLLDLDLEQRSIDGSVDMHFTATDTFSRLQIDLFENMQIDEIRFAGKTCTYERVFDAVFIDLPPQEIGQKGIIQISYHGRPVVARRAPWDGGFVFQTDLNGKPWVGVACEGDGASLWWPNKDHLSDEPDSMLIQVIIPENLFCVANGNLREEVPVTGGKKRFDWFVSYPINNYNVTINIGDYVHFGETYKASDGTTMPLDYYVLRQNEEVARKHFKQVPETLACFEQYFGKYPFWEDGYALVETPYLGMEHQGAIAYGNKYTRGYLGGMIPKDMNWDYIIVHETGHEYFGNSVSCVDHAEMWIHESFTTYMEALFVECKYGYADAVRYLESQRPFIQNLQPIVAPLNVNFTRWKSSDHYFKGSWVLHTLRHAIQDDELWFAILKGFYEEYAYSPTITEDFINYVNQETGKNFGPFFEQYLYHPRIPKLIYTLEQSGQDLKVEYKWLASTPDFDMPILFGEADNYRLVYPETGDFKTIYLEDLREGDFRIATDLFLVNARRQ